MRKILLAAAIALLAPLAAHAQAYTQVEVDLGYYSAGQDWYSAGDQATVQGWSTNAAYTAAIASQAAAEAAYWKAWGNALGETVTPYSFGICVPSPSSINTAGAMMHYRYYAFTGGTTFSVNVTVDTAAHCTSALLAWESAVSPISGALNPHEIVATCILP